MSDIGLGNDLWIWYQSTGNKLQNRQKGLYQTKKFLQNKGKYQHNEKATYSIWGYLPNHVSELRLISKCIVTPSIQQQNEQPNQKMGKSLTCFSKEDIK